MSRPAEHRPTEAIVDLGAIRHNVGVLADRARPAELCVVVKADGYGHGAVEVGRAALDAGAGWLAVALAEEAVPLRAAGVDAPVLLLAEPSPAETDLAVEHGLEVALYRHETVDRLADASAAAGRVVAVHVKVDTGMHRVGCAPDELLDLVRAVEARPELRLAAVWTHCARADEPGHGFTNQQLALFRRLLDELKVAGIDVPLAHAANSAALLAFPDSRLDLCRVGIAAYGIEPGPLVAGRAPLRPAMSVRSRVSHVFRAARGEGISYGHHYVMPADGWVAVIPAGYADGVARRLPGQGGQVLLDGHRRPMAGVVTMDQLCIDCGDHRPEVGDEVVLIGRQGDEEITAAEWAERLGTIGYEVVCAVGSRVPRRYRDGPC